MTPTSCIEIDLGQLDANLAAWQSILAEGSRVCAVVKADAYGLGAVPIAQRLAAHGVKLLAVYNMNQATQLAAAGVNANLLVLMPVDSLERTDVLYRWAVSGRLHMTVHNADQLGAIESIGLKFGAPMPVHIEIDTGMSRTGMSPEEAQRLIMSLPARRYVRLAGVFTHPARADDSVVFTQRQFDQFDQVIRNCATSIKDDVLIHFANTYATLRDPRYHRSMVRLGLGLFGYGIDDLVGPPVLSTLPAIEPIVRWTSRIVHEHDVAANVPVGYHGKYLTRRPTRLGVVPIGHADGYPLALGDKAVVRVGEALAEAPVRGQINMDQISIDISQIPDAGVGTPVELIASDASAPNALPRLAKLAQSSIYELLCRLSTRTQRRYTTTDHATGRVGHVATV
jgi:alanine racemase